MGMIGGGPGAFIGAVHRIAARLDGETELVCGAFSSDAEKSYQAGKDLMLDPARVYASYEEMISSESLLPATVRIDFVSIVTPNHLHFAPAQLALKNGFHVVLDKPVTFSLEEAVALKELIGQSGKLFCLTHTYSGYPMVKEARHQVQSGCLGAIRKIFVEYPQGWLNNFLEGQNHKQANWRTDPAKSGIAGASGDIGTHAFHLAEYVSGLQVQEICADLRSVVPGRKLDDDAAVLLRFSSGASGVLIATQVAAGEENNIRIRVYGEKGGLEWQQADAASLRMLWPDKPVEVWRAGTAYLSPIALHHCRVPPGHPEGYLEAFANHYRNFALCVQAQLRREQPLPEWLDFPGIEEGIRGMLFIEKIVQNSTGTEKWTHL